MTILLILLIAITLFVLNRWYLKPREPKKVVKYQKPVAKEYNILYIYAGVSTILWVASNILTLIFMHSWDIILAQYKTYQAQLYAQHLTPFSLQFFETMVIVGSIIGGLIWLWIMFYLITSKNKKRLVVLLSALLGLEIIGLLFTITKLNMMSILGILQACFTAIVLYSLVKEKKILTLKMINR